MLYDTFWVVTLFVYLTNVIKCIQCKCKYNVNVSEAYDITEHGILTLWILIIFKYSYVHCTVCYEI